MSLRNSSAVFALIAAPLVLPFLLLAQAVRPSAAPVEPSLAPDLSGFWFRPANVGPRETLYFTKEEPPMLPWAAERYKEIRIGRKGSNDVRPDQGRDDLDSAQYPYCFPYGFPREYATDAFEIVQNPDRVYVLFEDSEVQRIYTDGRGFPKKPPLTFMGQSIGHWEGDTLAVETKDINELTWIDRMGHPHSDALRVEQRIRRVDHDTLEIDFLFDDPKTYTKSWGGKRVFKLRRSTEYVFNYFLCEDPASEAFARKTQGKKEGQ